MRHIKDDAYLFSTANINRGEILAARCAKGGDARGERLFSVLDIERGDVDFFNERLSFGSENVVLLSGRGKSARAVLILRFFSYSSASCLAIVPEVSPSAIRELFGDGETDKLRFSPAFLRHTDGCRANVEDEGEAQLCFSELISCLRSLYALKLQYFLPDVEQVSDAVLGVARFIGVSLDYDVLCDRYEDASSDLWDNVYLGPLCCAYILAWAMEARENSRERKLSVRLYCGSRGHRMSFYYEPMSDTVPESLQYLQKLAQTRNSSSLLIQDEGVLRGELIPIFFDVGMSEVKNRGESVRLTDIERALYNYQE